MSTDSKDSKATIYLDVDEEITSIISKLSSSPKKIVALVLPRRATVLQSIVNMKLLKRSADQAEKNIVLITSEAGLLPLAGAAGIYVAASLNVKPYLPPSPLDASAADPDIESASLEDPAIDPATPIGDLVGDDKAGETIQIDNSLPAAAGATAAGSAAAKAGGKKGKTGKKKLSVPNFSRFRKQLIIGAAALVLLIVALFWALAIAPRATITLKTESKEVASSIDFTADSAATALKLDEKIVPAEKKDLSKTDTEKVAATGQKDKGTKAGGTVSLKNCGNSTASIPAGTGVSSGSLTFITQQTVSLSDGNFDGDRNCKNSGDHTGSVNVVAQENGDKYNLAVTSYTVSGFSSVTAQGSAMTGGTSAIVKVVTAQDVEIAKQKIADKQKTARDELKSEVTKDDLVALTETFSPGTPVVNVTPAVDSEANEVTVTSVATYTMLGVKKDDLKKLIKAELKDDPEAKDQNVLSEGIDTASFTVGPKRTETTASITIKTTVTLGPELNQDEIKRELAGKKHGEAESLLSAREGVTEARVKTGPFWVNKVPGRATKVTIVIQQANGDAIKP